MFIGFSISRPQQDKSKMGPHLMICKKKILRCLFPLKRIVIVLLIGFLPLFIIFFCPINKETYFSGSSMAASHSS
jgi:hypothetical protein